ncbi:MAG: diguanylate cyclase regulator RdcB family protein [Ottowia sp.]
MTETTNTALLAFKEALPCAVTSRTLIDMANSLDVVEDHVRVRVQRQGSFFPRMFDALSGQGARRDAAVTQHQQTTLRSLVGVTTHLAHELKNTNLALVQVGGRLGYLEHSLAHVAGAVADLRALHDAVQNDIRRIDEQLKRLTLRVAASEQLEHVFARWEAGRLAALPLASRANAALQELRWGAFGQFLKQHPGEAEMLRKTVKEKTTAALMRDARLQAANDLLGLSAWLVLPEEEREKTRAFLEGLDWLNEGATLQGPQGALKLCSQWPLLEQKSLETLPLNLPRAASPQRMASLLMDAALAPLQAHKTSEGEQA